MKLMRPGLGLILALWCVLGIRAQEDVGVRVSRAVANLDDPELRDESYGVLLRLGPLAVPGIKATLARWSEDEGSVVQLEQLLLILAELGADASSALDPLIDVIPRVPPSQLTNTLRALAAITPYLPNDRDAAIYGMNLVLPAVIREADDAMAADIRSEYSRVLARMSVDPHADNQALIWHVRNDYQYAREFAAELLGARGGDAADVLDTLIEVLRGPHNQMSRSYALGGEAENRDLFYDKLAGAILSIAPQQPGAAFAHAHFLTNASWKVRSEAAMALGRLGAETVPVLPALVAATKDADVRVVREAVTALGMVGPGATDAIPTLEELSKHRDEQVAVRARAALRQVRGSRTRRDQPVPSLSISAISLSRNHGWRDINPSCVNSR